MFSPEDNFKSLVWVIRGISWGLLSIAGCLIYFQYYPFEFESETPSTDGTKMSRTAINDVLLVLDYRSIDDSPNTFAKQDWSAAWINVLEQEVGPVTIATPYESLSKRLLDSARLIVLSASVADRFPSTLVPILKKSVRRGKTLVVERPGKTLRGLFSSDGDAGIQNAESISYLNIAKQNKWFSDKIRKMPLETDYIGSLGRHPEAKVHMSIDGAPVIYEVPFGKGRVVTIEMDLGRQLVALQQGVPGQEFRTERRRASSRSTAETADLSVIPGAEVPFADLFERFIVHRVLVPELALPTLWPFPRGRKGALISSHSTGEMGRIGLWMQRFERTDLTVSSNSYLTPNAVDPRKPLVDEDVGLLWHLESDRTERLGWAGIKPFQRKIGLGLQLERLESEVDGGIDLARIANGRWTSSWDGGFRQLKAVGIELDSSLASSDPGFGFGTGLTYKPLSDRGMPVGLEELPVVFPAQKWSRETILEFLERSQNRYHQAMTWNVDTQQMAERPNPDRFQAWTDILERADDYGHAVMSPRSFHHFQINRWYSKVRSDLQNNATVLLEKKLEDATRRQRLRRRNQIKQTSVPYRLSVKVESRLDNGYVTVPAVFNDIPFDFAREEVNRMGGELIGEYYDVKRRDLFGRSVVMIPLDFGTNRIQVVYGRTHVNGGQNNGNSNRTR